LIPEVSLVLGSLVADHENEPVDVGGCDIENAFYDRCPTDGEERFRNVVSRVSLSGAHSVTVASE
jgi:hypothetical protein